MFLFLYLLNRNISFGCNALEFLSQIVCVILKGVVLYELLHEKSIIQKVMNYQGACLYQNVNDM